MDATRYLLRPFRDEDYEGKARLEREADPEGAISAEETRHYDRLDAAEPERLHLRLAVEERGSGELVAHGSVHHVRHAFHPQKFFLGVVVATAHRRQGIGTALYRRLEAEAVGRRAICLWGGGRADDASCLRFLERYGYAPIRRMWVSRLDLSEAEGVAPPVRPSLSAAGIVVRSYSEEPLDAEPARRRLHELYVRASRDTPTVGDNTPVGYEGFVAQELEQPGLLPSASFVARLGDRYLGLTTVERDDSRPATARVGFTATDPEFRGRGIATELKRHSVEAARALGFRALVAFNDSTNTAIWAINEKLGFRRLSTWVTGEKWVASGATVPPAPPAGDGPAPAS
jgi:mycothiol synthase